MSKWLISPDDSLAVSLYVDLYNVTSRLRNKIKFISDNKDTHVLPMLSTSTIVILVEHLNDFPGSMIIFKINFNPGKNNYELYFSINRMHI